jgi:hypothetical protein
LDPTHSLILRRPVFLPDGKRFLYQTYQVRGVPNSPVYLASIDRSSESVRKVADAATSFAYANGYLLLIRSATLLAQPFDVAAGRTTGPPRVVAEQVTSDKRRAAHVQ